MKLIPKKSGLEWGMLGVGYCVTIGGLYIGCNLGLGIIVVMASILYIVMLVDTFFMGEE